ncbi:MAG: hypothetical protein A2487_09160 [Candidatus Raymondbacteria bacterium RifOxyC12_full_50_8]|uniref:Uncharacterized protein n=1 Tax=Candidatus Raymondbacteria bacterium RIFOXYD12_FULL_49_13 TaxID=1817890 RepID=A0A1F7FFL8_UNCRA|nr:MAG: hypothetical protein A2248_22780 [Candidatus Raymondbacteria bacterium RIFOXYA2_FULL_49_16]OGJ94588.1 MAG: hypothetical protein A2350_05890 [Candidatus Raymondbacteria bacterium RifOxyB12_full_50_8]OGJ98858.1 MAG: hypothetical protein A2487_09160 [Candidatus Raymondbacteria bacterium RifOxyC12_full_50_8]OGK05391.1 MAG: hypothetical protein A2519_03730 [Candidatus Raymondbacteria bacterium RIFOXYD12_FULL_49_13]OGP43004.1 MAG: hypothetical protein A2324_16435 [Candidatus Raymondbacteria b
MNLKNTFLVALLAIIALCLVKLAFGPASASLPSLVPSAHAEGGILEWKNPKRLVTSNENGSITYVWDYEGKTQVRKYYIEGNELKLQIYTLIEEK